MEEKGKGREGGKDGRKKKRKEERKETCYIKAINYELLE